MRFTLVYLTAALFAVAATAAPANRLLARGEGGGCAANSEPHCCQTISDTKNSTIASTLSKYGVPPEMAKGPVGLACKFAFFFSWLCFFHSADRSARWKSRCYIIHFHSSTCVTFVGIPLTSARRRHPHQHHRHPRPALQRQHGLLLEQQLRMLACII